MKKYLKYILVAFLAVAYTGCTEDDGLENATLSVPSNVAVDFSITQDNSGNVTIFPSADGANTFTVEFGDGSEMSEPFLVGENTLHTYAEGTYEVTVIATNLAGESAQTTQTLVVSFSAPENLEVTVAVDQSNPFLVSVSATADNAAAFEVYFGEDPAEAPTPMMIGETVTYEYSAIGTYTITVVALSGGAATTTYTQEITIVNPLLMPLDFESTTLDYSFTNFGGGDGVFVPIMANPDPSGANDSGSVAYYTKPAGSEVWAGTFVTLNEPIDFTETTTIAMDVYSPAAGVPIIFKVENALDGNIGAEVTVNTTEANAWETMYFTLPVDLAQTYSRIVLFFNYGTSGTGETYYFDNIMLSGAPSSSIPVTFEGGQAAAFQFNEFGGAPTNVVANPYVDGDNGSATVGHTYKVVGSETWAGAYTDLDDPVDFAYSNQLTMKVWSPLANAQVILKFENLNDPAIFAEATATTTVANGWETLTFDYGTVSTTQAYQRMVIFFNFGAPGANNDYYFDDIDYGTPSTTGPMPIVPVTFEENDIPFDWVSFGGGAATVITNPDQSGINTSAMVTEYVKPAGAETWAGASLILGSGMDFSTMHTVKVKVWSPAVGTTFLLKLEENASAYFMEVQATTTVANQWEELTFDFTGISTTNVIDVISFFPDFGNPGAGTTYYFDDFVITN